MNKHIIAKTLEINRNEHERMKEKFEGVLVNLKDDDQLKTTDLVINLKDLYMSLANVYDWMRFLAENMEWAEDEE